MARTVVAEAGNQGDSGMAGVVYTILNRLSDGGWGASVEAVVNAPGQFEPVMRAGGSWRGLKPATAAQEARVNTIVNLALDGRLPDLTHGARYFQNAQLVAARALAGTVSESLVNFGGAAPSAVVGAHAFYVLQGPGARALPRSVAGERSAPRSWAPVSIFVGENRAGEFLEASVRDHGRPEASGSTGDDGGGIFVRN